MAQVTCHACKAYFDVDFDPGTEFTCGSCGATVTVESPPTVLPTASKAPVGRKPTAGKAPVGRKPMGAKARPGRSNVHSPPPVRPTAPANMPTSGIQHAIGQDNSKRNTIIVGSILGGVLLLVAIIVMATNGGDGGETGERTGSGTSGKASPKMDPYRVAWAKAQQSGRLDDVKRFADMAWQRHESGRGTAKELADWAIHFRWASKQVLKQEPDNALAHERLGNVLFDINEAEALIELVGLDESLRDDIQILMEDIDDEYKDIRTTGGRVWLPIKGKKKEMAEQWKDYRTRAEKAQAAESSRATDSFYGTAESFGKTLAKELGNSQVDFRIDGVKEDPFTVFVHKPYVFLVQRSRTGNEDRIAQKWNSVLQSLIETFYRESGEACGVPPMTQPTPVVILSNGEEYVKYNRRGDDTLPTRVTSAGHFEPGNNRLVCYRSTDDAERTTLFHEGTHQIVSWAMKKGMGATRALTSGMGQSLWFSEGIADYYGGHGEEYRNSVKIFVPGRINLGRVDTLVDAKERGDIMDLPTLLDYTRAMYTRDNQNPSKSRTVLNAYAQGWALCYFIQQYKKAEYGAKWNEYLMDEFKGRSGKSAFTAVFGTANLPRMQTEYLEMIDVLGKAKKEGRVVNGELKL